MAFFLRRIHCHFCGTRSPYSKSSGIPDFQCASCEAVNFLDGKGNILDTPAAIAAQPQRQPQHALSFTEKRPEALEHQQNQAFCNTCLRNQRIYMEHLSNYLPDEDHPEYHEFERRLPQFKKDLEQKYPQICRRCAPKAQNVIHRADYYAGTQNVAALGRKTRARGGVDRRRQRDDWGKWCMRRTLGIVGLTYYACLLAQVAWHAYGIYATPTGALNMEVQTEDAAFNTAPRLCVLQSLGMSFNPSCYQMFGTYMGRALLVTACLIWYHQGLRHWFHPTYRVETVSGSKEYFWLQAIMLAVRTQAYYKMVDPAFTATLTRQQAIAVHSFMIVFMLLVQFVSNSVVKPVVFKLRMNMMPKPEDRDVLGALAGPEDVRGTPQASSIRPSELFARDRITPFPIANLAPKTGAHRVGAIPSPPPSDETDEDEPDLDAMDIDWSQQTSASRISGLRPRTLATANNQPPRSMYNHGSTQGLGWSGMRDEVFSIQDNLQLQTERQRREAEQAKLRYQPPVEQSPFRGRLPQAPMSLERKLRNPPSQFNFKQTPVSKQQNFMQQMRSGIDQGKAFARQQEAEAQRAQRPDHDHDDDAYDRDSEFSPAKLRTRGELQLKEGKWKWAGDQPKDTGLEDLLGGISFRIADEPAVVAAAHEEARKNSAVLKVSLSLAASGVVLVVAWAVQPIRRAVCLWVAGKLESMGY
ncbi:hypothetical protein B0A50_05735 [Salinomyces thailandicus]|uniref:Ima1 N-terminal domain-containing protein n=1 Tax=Salinomyces thailandicus TaxID=706561 RepID=A0A4U0TRP8_9PEZI|nr:hypothetical protein B0A50_05735 [Salinomyces thailandica]